MTTLHMFSDNGTIFVVDSDGDILCETNSLAIAERQFDTFGATIARTYPSTWRKIKNARAKTQRDFLANAKIVRQANENLSREILSR